MPNYSSFSNTVTPALIALLLSLLWLTSKMFNMNKLFNLLQKINDDRKIIIPSISVLISPFIAVKFWHLILSIYSDEHKTKIISSLMPLVAITLFLLTQFILSIKDKYKKQKLEESISKQSLNYLSYLFKADGEFIYIEGYLRCLLNSNCHKNILSFYISNIIKLAKILQNKLLNRKHLIDIDKNIHQTAYGTKYIFYLKQLEDYLEVIINFEWDNPMLEHDNDKFNKILDWLIIIIKLRAEASLLGSKLSKKNFGDKILANGMIDSLKEYLKDYDNLNSFNFSHILKINDELNIDIKPEIVNKVLYASPPKINIQKLENSVDEIKNRAKSEYQIEII